MANEENLKPWKKGESGNPNGRPKKSFASINAELKLKGIEQLSKADLIEAYALIFNTDEETLRDIAKDKKTPYAFKIILLELNDNKTRAKALQDYRDYTFGRAIENIDVNNNVTIFELPANGRESKEGEKS
jgi:hypothetical protein